MADWTVAIPILSALIGATVGGFVVHLFTARRESHNIRRAQRVEFLVLAYRRLTDASNRGSALSEEQRDGLESALSDVVLLGERAEIDAARQFMRQMADQKGADLEPLLQALRRSLRTELGLRDVPLPRPYSLRMTQ